MPSTLTTTTLQAAGFSALSNVLAQIITIYQADKPFHLNFTQLLQFVTWALISTPPNILWQDYLESSFPSNAVDSKGQKKLDKSNTLKKFALDQTFGSAVNNAAYLAGMSALKGKDLSQIQAAIQNDLWHIMSSGWKVWPLVSLLNFTVVPPGQRILVGSVVGLFWGVYISLLASG